MTPLFQRLIVEPTVTPQRYDQLGRWHVDVAAFDVTQEFIDILLDLWVNGDRVHVGFWYRGQWRSGMAYMTSVTPSVDARHMRQVNCAAHLVGTGNLT